MSEYLTYSSCASWIMGHTILAYLWIYQFTQILWQFHNSFFLVRAVYNLQSI